MQIVIKIPKKVYKAICDKNALGCDIGDIKNMIRNGTPLPKGHGRLIDESKITTVYFHKEEGSWKNIKYEHSIIDYTDAPTIIEADKED